MNLPIRYFHTCQWLFDAMQVPLDITAWAGQPITYLKSHQDILYALNVNGKKIFGYEQAYQQYKQLYLNEIKIAINQHSILLFSFALLSFIIESTYSKS
jgi:hypothetical protein